MNQANEKQSRSIKPPNETRTPKRTLPQTRTVPPSTSTNPTERVQKITENTAGSTRGPNTKGAVGLVADTTPISAGGTPKSVPKRLGPRDTLPSSNQPLTAENYTRTKPENIRKLQRARQSDSIAKGEDQKVEPVKPVLKTPPNTNQPPKRSGRIQRNKEKSVTFPTEQDAASALVPIQPAVTFKPATKTGFNELSAKDFSVILGFWSIRFFIPWVEAWHDFNFHVLREPSYWDSLEKDIRTQQIILFCIMNVMTISISVLADLINFRFFIFLVLLQLFVFCPVTGAICNAVLVARAYNEHFYRKYAFATNTLFHWASAIASVSFPIQLSCIFGQNEDMSRQAHYNWTAVLIFLDAINHYTALLVIPGKCPTRTLTQTAVWVLIGALIFTILFLKTNFSLIWAKPEIMLPNWHLKDSLKDKEQDNMDATSKRRKKCIWFFSILIVLIITSLVFGMLLGRLRPHEDWDEHNTLSATSMFFLGKILGSMFMVVVLTVDRWKLQRFHHLPFLRPDVLALGLPHMVNVIALVTLFSRYATTSYLKEGYVIIGPIPDNKKMVVEFFNFDFRNRTVCVHSTSFRPLKVGPRQRGTREIYGSGLSRINFTVSLDPKNPIELKTSDSFGYQGDTWATFIITLPFSNIRYSDIRALYSKLEIVRVEGTEQLRPKKKPQIFFMNTFFTKINTKFLWTFVVEQKESGFHHEFHYMLRSQTVIQEVPKGRVEIKYHLANSTIPPVTTAIEAEDYCVWAVLLGHSRPLKKAEREIPRMIGTFKTMETAEPGSKRLPSNKQLQKDVAIIIAMALAGIASSGIFIGTIYLFWLDTPIMHYRTTCIGVFWVFMEMPVQLFKIIKVDVGFLVISVLTFLQIICTVLHFIAAIHLYTPKFNFRNRPD